MDFTIEEKDGKTYAKITGRVGTAETAEFEKQMRPLFMEDNPDIYMDCSGLEYVSSSGLRLFFTLQQSVNERKGHLVVANLTPVVRRVFDMTGFSKIINVQ